MHSAHTSIRLLSALGLVAAGVIGIVTFVWLFTRITQGLSGLRPFAEHYPAPRSPTTELALGNVFFFGNFWILGTADEHGIYFEGTLVGGSLAFVPWSEMDETSTLPGYHVFRVARLGRCVFVSDDLVRRRPKPDPR
jgi:hypothetical protein